MRGVFWRPWTNFKQEAVSQINPTRYPWKQKRASSKIRSQCEPREAPSTERLKISGWEETCIHVGKLVGRGSTKTCKAEGSVWFRNVVDGFQLWTSMKSQVQNCGERLSWGAASGTLSTGGTPNSSAVLSTPCEGCCSSYLTRGKVWAIFTSFASPGSKTKAELPEQETLSSSCGWKLGHARILCPNAPVKPRQSWEPCPAFPDNKTMFLPLNACNGYHVDNKT